MHKLDAFGRELNPRPERRRRRYVPRHARVSLRTRAWAVMALMGVALFAGWDARISLGRA